MEETQPKNEARELVSEQDIAAYLRSHPEFFVEHLDLLATLEIPHSDGQGVVSLIEHQVRVLRDRHRNEQRQLLALVETARENERVSERLHKVAIETMSLDDLDNALDTLSLLIRELFRVDFVSFRIERSNGERMELVEGRSPQYSDLRSYVANGRSVCNNQLPPALLSFLFNQSDNVGSLMLIPLGGTRPLGVIALGAIDGERFKPNQGTFYLDRLGELLGALLQRLLD